MGRNRRRGPNGEPWFRKFNKGWYVTTDGKPVPIRDKFGQQIKGEDRRNDALAVWHEMMAVTNAPLTGEDNEVRIVLDLYLRHLEQHATAKTFSEWLGFFKAFKDRYPGLLVRGIKPAHLTQWWGEHPTWGSSYRNLIGSAFKAAFNWAAGADGNNIIPRNPLDGMKLPRVKSRGANTLISDEDHARLLEIAPDDLRQVLIALRNTGTRPSNVWRATKANLDITQQALVYAEWNTDPSSAVHKTFKKTGQPLVIPLTPPVFEMCRRLAAKYPEGPLFRTKKGLPWDACKLANRLLWYKNKLGLKNVICYGYRHTVATELLEGGVPDAEVAAILGHKNTSMIYRHYSHLGARITRLRETLTRHRPTLDAERAEPEVEKPTGT